MSLSARRFTINHDHLRRYLVNGYKSLYKTPATFYREVREVPAGEVLERTPRAKRRPGATGPRPSRKTTP